MTLLFAMNLGFAWGSVAVVAATADVTVLVQAWPQTVIVPAGVSEVDVP